MPLAEDMNPVRNSEDKKIDISKKEELYQYPHISNGMKNIVEDIISSYENRIQNIGAIFETTHQLLEGFQNSFLDTRQERERLNAELRDNLAKNKSLRRKDFDNMMQGILCAQDEREKEVKNLLKTYLNEQKQMACALGENLGKFKNSLTKGEAERMREFQNLIKGILARQDERRVEVTLKLREFQKEQKDLANSLKQLLAKGRELRIKDLKSMLAEFKTRHKERISRQEERRQEIKNLLGGFKKERQELAENWQSALEKMAQRRTKPR